MSNMVWTTFFLTLFSGAITALIGVYVQQWYSQKRIRKRLIRALEDELKINLDRINGNIAYLKHLPSDVDERRKTLVVPYSTQAYEMLLIEDPELFFELNKQTHNGLMELYGVLISTNSHYPAMVFGFRNYPDVQEAIQVLKNHEMMIVKVLEVLENWGKRRRWKRKQSLGEGEVTKKVVINKDVLIGFYFLVFAGAIFMSIGGLFRDDFAIALGTTFISIGFSIIAIEIGKASCNTPGDISKEMKELEARIENLNNTLDELRETLGGVKKGNKKLG